MKAMTSKRCNGWLAMAAGAVLDGVAGAHKGHGLGRMTPNRVQDEASKS